MVHSVRTGEFERKFSTFPRAPPHFTAYTSEPNRPSLASFNHPLALHLRTYTLNNSGSTPHLYLRQRQSSSYHKTTYHSNIIMPQIRLFRGSGGRIRPLYKTRNTLKAGKVARHVSLKISSARADSYRTPGTAAFPRASPEATPP